MVVGPFSCTLAFIGSKLETSSAPDTRGAAHEQAARVDAEDVSSSLKRVDDHPQQQRIGPARASAPIRCCCGFHVVDVVDPFARIFLDETRNVFSARHERRRSHTSRRLTRSFVSCTLLVNRVALVVVQSTSRHALSLFAASYTATPGLLASFDLPRSVGEVDQRRCAGTARLLLQ